MIEINELCYRIDWDYVPVSPVMASPSSPHTPVPSPTQSFPSPSHSFPSPSTASETESFSAGIDADIEDGLAWYEIEDDDDVDASFHEMLEESGNLEEGEIVMMETVVDVVEVDDKEDEDEDEDEGLEGMSPVELTYPRI